MNRANLRILFLVFIGIMFTAFSGQLGLALQIEDIVSSAEFAYQGANYTAVGLLLVPGEGTAYDTDGMVFSHLVIFAGKMEEIDQKELLTQLFVDYPQDDYEGQDYPIGLEVKVVPNYSPPLLAVSTWTGSIEEPVESLGLIVYRFDGEKLEMLFNTGDSRGAPKWKDINGDGLEDIIVYDGYWPAFMDWDFRKVIMYPLEAYTYKDGYFVSDAGLLKEYIATFLDGALSKYQRVKTVDDYPIDDGKGSDIYLSCVGFLVLCKQGGFNELADKFWEEESGYLEQTLSDEAWGTLMEDFLK